MRMLQSILVLCLLISGNALAQPVIGKLDCQIVPDSGINLLIHSTRDVRCTFTPADGGPNEYYKGETGVGLGIDINLNKRAHIIYAVQAEHFAPGTHALAGKYEGAGGGITLGASVGETTPLRKRDRSIALQPMHTKHRGAGASLGFNYLYLEPDNPR